MLFSILSAQLLVSGVGVSRARKSHGAEPFEALQVFTVVDIVKPAGEDEAFVCVARSNRGCQPCGRPKFLQGGCRGRQSGLILHQLSEHARRQGCSHLPNFWLLIILLTVTLQQLLLRLLCPLRKRQIRWVSAEVSHFRLVIKHVLYDTIHQRFNHVPFLFVLLLPALHPEVAVRTDSSADLLLRLVFNPIVSRIIRGRHFPQHLPQYLLGRL
mmetsp:Transcript_40256/g.110737  ORF Transcript_40256/g.110737 Transcript_40256/m.110737 type:complete len:213 (+) Transcript_40256:379-1017(+)